jgi:hypothetical protein
MQALTKDLLITKRTKATKSGGFETASTSFGSFALFAVRFFLLVVFGSFVVKSAFLVQLFFVALRHARFSEVIFP